MDAPWTAVYNTPNKSIRQNVARRGVVLHHAAMTSLSGLRDMEVNGTKQVSSTAICKDDNLELIVPDNNYRPWSLSSAYWDSAMRSVETCNESTNGWTISDKSHWSLARAVAYWSTTDGFWPHRDGDPSTWTVIGHREVYTIHGASYATACPGGMDLNLVVARAQSILRGGTAGGGTKPLEEEEMKFRIVNPTDPGDNAIYALSEVGSWVKIANTSDLQLLQKFLAQGTIEDITKGQVTIIRQYLKALYPQPAAPTVDVVALADALAANLPAVTGGLSREQLIEAVEAAVEDVPTQTVDELRGRL